MSVEIRTFTGSAEELSQFVVKTWLDSYGGTMAVPEWTPQYFDWQMTGEEFSERDYLISAWDGDKLVGVVLGMPFPLWVAGEEHPGAQGSWLSVDPKYRRHGVAKLMSAELNRRQQEKGCIGRIGYAFRGSRKSLGPRFWKTAKKSTKFIRDVRLWARVLNPDAVSRWGNSFIENVLLKYLPNSVCNIGEISEEVSIRRYAPADLLACHQLINQQAEQADLAVLWKEDRLARQLQFEDLADTLVVEREGEVVGFVNYHFLEMHLNGKIQTAVIDLFACENLVAIEVTSLLNHLCQMLKDRGVAMILMREFASQPQMPILRARFIPQPADSTLLFSRSEDKPLEELPQLKTIQVLWR